ncbi:MAG: iron-sulfur cluster assembly protein [Candidatus Binatia bacterium]|nr:iron-sulfur cluster assembly protein [Candidatus Binatia bacterium]
MPSLFQRLKTWWTKPPAPPLAPPTVAQNGTGVVDCSTPAAAERALAPQTPDLAQIYDALRGCHDPEIPVNIVDLGLVYDVQVEEGRVDVKMSLTTRGCGMGGYIASEAAERVRALPGVREVNVEIVWDPPWTPEMISPAGRKILGLPE